MRISLFPYLQLFLFLHAIVRVQGNVKVVALNEQPLSFLNLHDEGDPSYVIGISETGTVQITNELCTSFLLNHITLSNNNWFICL